MYFPLIDYYCDYFSQICNCDNVDREIGSGIVVCTLEVCNYATGVCVPTSSEYNFNEGVPVDSEACVELDGGTVCVYDTSAGDCSISIGGVDCTSCTSPTDDSDCRVFECDNIMGGYAGDSCTGYYNAEWAAFNEIPDTPSPTGAPVEAPSTPAPAGSAPTMGGTPSAPTMDVTPSAPSAPTMDATPSAPTMDATPSAPSMDATPSAPSMDVTPSTPTMGGSPSAPTVDTTPSAPTMDVTPTVPEGGEEPTSPQQPSTDAPTKSPTEGGSGGAHNNLQFTAGLATLLAVAYLWL